MIAGACLCGAVRYEVDGPLSGLVHCHCSTCRKHHGAPFASVVEVPLASFRWLSAPDGLFEYASSTSRTRAYCGVCGSVAPALVGERMLVPAGNLVGELGVQGGVHMFVGSKAVWHLIGDELPRYEGPAPGWQFEMDRPTVPALQGATHGSCLCGSVTFSVTGMPARWMQCHCSRCRRGRSAAHGSNTFYPLNQFTWLSGRDLVLKYKPPEAERFMVCFCTQCGGGAPVERDNVPFVLVPAGLFDGDPGGRPEAHIHVASKASWYSVDDGLPQFPELPPPA